MYVGNHSYNVIIRSIRLHLQIIFDDFKVILLLYFNKKGHDS